MPLPTAAELTDPNATNSQMKQRLGQLAENVESKEASEEKFNLVKSYTEDSLHKYTPTTKYNGLGKYTVSQYVLPIIADANNKILFGYNIVKDSLEGVGLLNSEDIKGAGTYLANKGIIPFYVDENNKVILGYDPLSDKLVGVFDEIETHSTSIASKPLPFNLETKAYNWLLAYGQSLSVGVMDATVLSSVQPFSNKTFSSGVRSTNNVFTGIMPLVEQSAQAGAEMSDTDGARQGETTCSGAANYASLLAYRENGKHPNDHIIFASTAGHGSYSISQLAKGSTWYNSRLLGQFNGAKTLMNDIALHALCWLQGEANAKNAGYLQSTHYNALLQLQADIEADAKSILGQTSPVLFLTYQLSTYAAVNDAAVHLALLEACQKSDKFYFVAPTHPFPHTSDGVHLTAVGYKHIGAYYGRAYKQAVFDKIQPKAIMPLGAVLEGKKITVSFEVPHLPLILDSVNLPPTQDFGFAVFAGGTRANISSVKVANGNQVVLDLQEAPTSNDVVVTYALTNLATGLNILSGASGNLRDSCSETITINSAEKNMFYHCPHFKLNVISGAI